MLAGLSESVTLTLVVLLVLGSICYYLYSRILLNENRMSLIESLLMDLKMSNDLRAMEGFTETDQDHVQENNHNSGYNISAQDCGLPVNSQTYSYNLNENSSNENNVQIDEDFGDVIAKAVETSTGDQAPAVLLASADSPSLVSGMPINQETPLPSGNGQLVSNVENLDNEKEEDETDTPFLDNLNDIKATDNSNVTNVPFASLESMTAKELHNLAKQRKVPGESKMNRAELIEALRA